MGWACNFLSRLPEGFDNDDILFLKQIDVQYTYVSLTRSQHHIQAMREIMDRIHSGGLEMRNVQSNLFTFNTDIALGTKNRDQALTRYREFIDMCAEVGIRSIELNMMPFFVYSSGIEATTRGAKTRTTDIHALLNSKTPPLGRPAWLNEDLEDCRAELERLYREAEARTYTREELWDNFSYFMESVMPRAEERGVRISLHPADPPCQERIGGVPQLIRSFADYQKAFQIAGSPALGMTFCCGCWLEGGAAFGDLLRDMEWCLEHKKIDVIHMRNISAPLPKFDETFIDNGFYDYYPVFKLLRKYRFSGLVNPDHNPVMVDGVRRRAPQSYNIGFMRAYAMRADAEFENSPHEY